MRDYTSRQIGSTHTLDNAKQYAYRLIDRAAEAARARHITTNPGHLLAYQEKSEEAADYAASGYPPMGDPPEYPFIYADANAYSIAPREAADQILLQKAKWVNIGAEIEYIRLNGKVNINMANTESKLNAIRSRVIEKLNNI